MIQGHVIERYLRCGMTQSQMPQIRGQVISMTRKINLSITKIPPRGETRQQYGQCVISIQPFLCEKKRNKKQNNFANFYVCLRWEKRNKGDPIIMHVTFAVKLPSKMFQTTDKLGINKSICMWCYLTSWGHSFIVYTAYRLGVTGEPEPIPDGWYTLNTSFTLMGDSEEPVGMSLDRRRKSEHPEEVHENMKTWTAQTKALINR